MRIGVVVCGANGERGVLLENAIQEFAKSYMDKVIQVSACTAAVTPMLLQVTGVDPNKLIAVNGCRNKCADAILAKANVVPKISIIVDDAVKRSLGRCQSTIAFDFPDLNEQEAKDFAQALGKAVDGLLS